ncbi:HpcH/HpaI aldolase family protein [Halocynthiibacter namhaensis]|uniref:HpcH/HpaI aldolase family protein n=1 Tax=Halocynthiibacter namhaensis TaxID=1290553 RepID=UPI0005790E6E|nr:HpcH/HpaI aldolase/citrate lyase family protein [Halocynthiibacter namhaensis]
MHVPENKLAKDLRAGQVNCGLWMGAGSPTLAEIAARAGFDWCLIDGEHNPNSDDMALGQLQAMAGGGAAAVMRVASAEDWLIKRALDIGVQTLVVPMIHNAEDARRVAAACRYPGWSEGQGSRGMGAYQARASGYGAYGNYVAEANDQVFCFVQAESREALENIDEIAATPGVDGVFIGPADLSADMGHPGNPGAPEVQEAIAHICSRVQAAGKPLGTVTFDVNDTQYLIDRGFQFIGVGGDLALFANAARQLAERARGFYR